jgi:hypothetical protein
VFGWRFTEQKGQEKRWENGGEVIESWWCRMVRRWVVFGGVRVSFVTIGLYFRNEHVPIYKLVRKVKWPENFPVAGSWPEVVVAGGGSEGGREREKCVCVFFFLEMKMK